jgi:aldehyde dehydrogenase (NAD+)
VLGYVDIGKKEGAELLIGGSRHGTEGYYVQPTIFGNVQDNMRIAKEEIFGPVMSILKFKTIDEVVKRANRNDYGLAAGVWTTSIDTANTISRNLRSGTVWVNCFDEFDAAVPFGGYKKSGFGKDKSSYALQNYTEVKTVQMPMFNSNWK